MNPWIAVIGLLGAMTLGVVATMVVENWHRLTEPVPRSVDPLPADCTATAPGVDTTPAAAPGSADAAQRLGPPERSVPTAAPAATPSTPSTPSATPSAPTATQTGPTGPPEAGRPDGALVVTGPTVVLRDHDTADVLAGLLFAGYSVSGRSGADRAAAWVTATATPPSADPERFAPGVRLRGKTARVAALLDHHDDGVVWVGLQHGVDIRRGLARSPVTQPTLAGLVTWWQLTDELPATLEPDAAGLVAEAVSAIAGELRSTPWADVVEVLRTTLAGAAAAGTALTVALADSSTGDAETEGALPALLSADPMPAALRS